MHTMYPASADLTLSAWHDVY